MFFSLSDIRKHKRYKRSQWIYVNMAIDMQPGRHMTLSHSVIFSVSSLRNLDTDANTFYD